MDYSLEENEVVLLDNVEYVVVKKIDKYYMLLSTKDDAKIVIGVINDNTLEEVTDINIIKNILCITK